MVLFEILIQALKKEHNECLNLKQELGSTKPTLKYINADTECLKRQSEFEACSIIQEKIKEIFYDRQKIYFDNFWKYKYI